MINYVHVDMSCFLMLLWMKIYLNVCLNGSGGCPQVEFRCSFFVTSRLTNFWLSSWNIGESTCERFILKKHSYCEAQWPFVVEGFYEEKTI